MTHAHRLKLRCFLEGIEVPVIAATLAIQPNAPAQFQVQIPATDKAFEFLPRTLIHLFFFDYWEGPSDLASITLEQDEQVEDAEDAQDTEEETQRSRDEHYERSRELRSNPHTDNPDTDLQDAQRSSGSQFDTFFQNESAPSAAGRQDSSGEGDSPNPELRANPFASDGSLRDNPFEDTDSLWKLLIGGEVIGYEFAKSSQQRSIVLHCLDFSVYWDTCYQYKVNVASLTGDGMAAFVGAGTTFFDTFFSSTTSAIVSAVNRPSVTQPELTGLLSGVVRLLESVGGVYIGNESQSLNGANPQHLRHRFRGVNDFFSIAELRLKLVYMITAAESDESSRRHFAARAFAMWGRRYASRLGKIASFREILNVMMQYIFHAVYPVAAPRYVHPSERLRTSSRTTTSAFSETPRGRRFIADLTGVYNGTNYVRNDMRSGTGRILPVPTILARLRSVGNRCSSYAIQAQGYGHSSPAGYLNTAAAQIQAIKQHYTGNDTSQQAVYQRHRGDIDGRIDRAIRNISVAVHYFDRSSVSRTRTSTRTVETGIRLNQQIIRPDCFMVSPPRCNIIFPELASQISFQRMYMREVTRMRLTVSDAIFGPEQLLDSVYYAPDVEVLGARPPRRKYGRGSDAGQVSGPNLSRAAYSKRLMEHELYTGVVPVFERMNEVNIYAARTDSVSHRGARIPYVVRAVNHQFFKNRWAPRTASVSGKFNPWVVAGFPAVIMDRYMTRDQVAESSSRGVDYLERSGRVGDVRADAADDSTDMDFASEEAFEAETNQYDAWQVLRDNTPTQIVGLVESLQHTVSNQGPSADTSMALTHARTHRENEELLGSNRQTLTRRSLIRSRTSRARRSSRGRPGGGTESRIANTASLPSSQSGVAATSPARAQPGGRPIEGRAVKTTTVAAINAPEVGMVGPYNGEVTAVAPSTETGSFPLFGTFFGDRVRRRWRKFPVEIEMRAVMLGDEVVTQAGGSEETVILHAYRITEAIDRWRGQQVDVPLEDFIRPPWMSDVWRNDRIGATYQQFFGTGALTDSMIIETGNVMESQSQYDQVDRLLADSANQQREDNVIDPVRGDGSTSQGAGMELNIERAIDLLVRSYSAIKHEGLDVHEFIRAYTWRPVATISDILGSPDLELDQDGNVTEGKIGLHSKAFGRGPHGQNLRNLVGSDARQVLGLDTGTTEVHRRTRRATAEDGTVTTSVSTSRTVETAEERTETLERMDKRAEKSDRVLAYVEELTNRGLLG